MTITDIIERVTRRVTLVTGATASAPLLAEMDAIVATVEDRLMFGAGGIDKLRRPEMETSATVSCTSGVGTLPTDCLELVRLIADAGYGDSALEYAPADRFAVLASQLVGSEAIYWTSTGRTVEIAPRLTTTLRIVYYKRLPTLVGASAAASNWLIELVPDAYRLGLEAEAFALFGKGEQAAFAGAQWAQLVRSLNSQGVAAAVGGNRLKRATTW